MICPGMKVEVSYIHALGFVELGVRHEAKILELRYGSVSKPNLI